MFGRKKLPPPPPPPRPAQYDYKDDVANYLPLVLIQGAGASYIGGSIGFKLSTIRPLASNEVDDLILVSTGDEKWPPVVLFWAGLCYLKFMGKNKNTADQALKACEFDKYKAVDLVFKFLKDSE